MSGQKRYYYNTPNDGKRVIGVMQVNNAGNYGVVWLGSDGVPHVLRTPNLPRCADRDVCQRALDQFAAKRGLETATGGEPVEAPHGATTNDKPASAWRTDEPPQDKIVIARVAGDEFGFRYSYKHGETWYDLNSKYTVTGWMHIEDAVRILDAAKDVQ